MVPSYLFFLHSLRYSILGCKKEETRMEKGTKWHRLVKARETSIDVSLFERKNAETYTHTMTAIN